VVSTIDLAHVALAKSVAPAALEVLVSLERGHYPLLQALLDHHARGIRASRAPAEYVAVLLRSAAKKIQGAAKPRSVRRQEAAGVICRATVHARNRRRAVRRATALRVSVLRLQAVVRGRLARNRVRRMRGERLARVAELLRLSLERYRPELITHALLEQAARPPPPPPREAPSVASDDSGGGVTWAETIVELAKPPPGCCEDGAGAGSASVSFPLPRLVLRWEVQATGGDISGGRECGAGSPLALLDLVSREGSPKRASLAAIGGKGSGKAGLPRGGTPSQRHFSYA
jgi:hypothetical protein